MDTPLSGDKLQEERAFVKRYTDTLSGHGINYADDFTTPLEDRPRKVQVVQIPIAEPPSIESNASASTQDTTINVTIKSLKPSLTIPLTLQSTEPVLTLKNLIASSPNGPPIETQRLLLKGKALTDTKLLKEYDISDGAIIHLLLKPAPASTPTPTPTPTPAVITSETVPEEAVSLSPSNLPLPRTRHTRTASDPAAFALNDKLKASSTTTPPSLVITTSIPSPSGSPDNLSQEEITLTTPLTISDTSVPPIGPQPRISSVEFHNTISDPAFWTRLHEVCKESFVYEDDGDTAWETFLVAMKGRLSAGETAKIRDVVGINGMGGGA